MSILSGFKKYKNYKTDANGDHQLQSFWTSSDSVDGNITEASTRANLVNGETLTTSLGKIKKFFSDLGSSAFKNTTNTYDPSGTDPVTGQAVAQAIESLPEPMVYKGTLGTGGTITTLPTASSANEGFTYKVITAGTYASQDAKVGDTFTSAKPEGAQNYEWVLFPSGDEPSGTVTNVATGTGLTGGPITSTGTISHADTSSQASVTNSGRTYIQSVTLDDMGHVTALSSATETVTNTDRYVNSAAFAHDSTNDNVKMTLTRAGSDTATVTGNIPKVSSSSAGVAPKGATVSSQSQSTKFLREDGSWAAPSYTVNTNTTYTFANGTNGFTVTPSGGSAQTVTVTPSISNNVTGSGTSGYIAKFNGANTITNGPAFGSATTTYLRNDGSWATPSDTNTHRPIQMNGTEILGNNTTALNLKAGTNVSLSNSSGTVTITATDTTYSSKSAASGGTDVSLCTTGEKYTWNNKSNLTLGTTATTAAKGNHTHTTSIATSTGTNQISLAASTKYAITAGGTSYVFTTPADTNTWRPIGTGASDAAAGNHTHTCSIATSSGTNQLTLAFGTKYALTAGGNSYVFTMPSNPNTDTKNTAGSTNSTDTLFLVGATSQTTYGTTYSNVNCYVSSSRLYSNGKQVVNLSDSQALTNKTYNGYTLAAACAKAVQDSSSATSLTASSLPTGQTITSYLNSKLYSYTGTGDYISTFTIQWFIIGYLCVFSISFKVKQNISSSTGFSYIKNTNFPTPAQSDATAAVTETVANNQLRHLGVSAGGPTYRAWRAIGPYATGTEYKASGAFVIAT